MLADTPTNIAERFSAALQRRGEPLRQTGALLHEIRRAVGYFRAPLTTWSYHNTCYGHYLAYLQNTNGVVVDIYPNEQNTHRVRRWIQQYVDPTMSALLDLTVTALLNDLEIFRLYALCYTMVRIPKRPRGSSATAAEVYYLGHTELASVADIDELSFRILRTHIQLDGVWQSNEAVQRALTELWQDYAAVSATPEKLAQWLEELQQRAWGLELPTRADGQPIIHREHLKKAMQAAVCSYIAEVKQARGLL